VLAADFDLDGDDGLRKIRRRRQGWIEARVPGEIHLDLIRAGKMPEPTLGANMPECRWPETRSWWYRTQFGVAPDFLQHERQCLVFDGLDLYAQVFVNGKLAGESANAFVPACFDVERRLRAGTNELVVRLTAGSELARDATPPGQGRKRRANQARTGAIPNPPKADDLYGPRMWPGRKWLRKPQFSYGWDWVDALPNIGVWRSVHLEGRTHAVLHDLRLDTVRSGADVGLEMEATVENLHPWSERAGVLALEIQPPDGGSAILRQYSVNLPAGRLSLRDTIEIPDARLWWPNGMGDQPLYRVVARVIDPGGVICDSRKLAIGLRTIEIDRSPLAQGSRFCFKVNGEEVFCRGANTGPHDAIPARISAARYEALAAEARNANMNMIRINACSIFEGARFYEACDRAGVMIWHDFMFTCTTYPDDQAAFRESVRAESEAAVLLLRHHPSIVLWCGNNECTWGFRDWWNPDKTKPLELGGARLYNRILPDLCRRLDPRRPYWPGSPCGGDEPNSELDGDCHWWGPFFMNPDLNRRIRHQVFDECRSRFVSEYGVIGPCHLDSIREYLAPAETTPGSLAWRMHTNTFEKDTVPAAIRLHYADPEGLTLPEYVAYGQMFQASVHGRAMEALRFRKGDPRDDCAGALIWSYSDCWGETGWSILDYYLRRKAAYYWFRRACAPVKVIVRQRGDQLVTRVVNDTRQAVKVLVEFGWRRLDGAAGDVASRALTVDANSMLEVAAAALPPAGERDPRQWLYAAVLRAPDGLATDQSVWLLRPFRELQLEAPRIDAVKVSGDCLEVSSPVFAHAVHAEDHGREMVSDNWFDLLPATPVRIRVASGFSPESIRFEALLPK